jgi:hypothetical protein
MSDFLSVITPSTDLNVTDVGGPSSNGTSLDTGDLRRKFNFGKQVSELSIAQDPFFRFVSKVGKKPTDDPSFKFTEKRPSWHKRYAYIVAYDSNGTATYHDSTLAQSDVAAAVSATGQNVALYMATDYKASGNVQNIYGNSGNAVNVGATGTRPTFFFAGQLVKIPVTASSSSATVVGYHVMKVASAITADITTNAGVDDDSMECVKVTGVIVKYDSAGNELASFNGGTDTGFTTASSNGSNVSYDKIISSALEPKRSYIMGTAHEEGSGYPETWKDQPYSTGFGYTQIWKTSMAMTNTARATVLKYEPNEWARVWKEKLVEHKYDIEQSLLFGNQASISGTQYTEGAVPFISQYGNTFSLATTTKTADDFLEDMSSYLDPRYNNSTATVFFCNTAVYNWLHKLGGYFSNNLNINSNFSADLAITGRKKVLGLDTTNITTPFGDMNVVRNIHLDGTNVQMLGINMKYAKYRPLVGNGVNRDTSVYVGVQTLENSGVDRRVDLILTEAGMEWSMPECHAIWTA